MKKKLLILAAVAVSGVAAVVASNTNKVFGASDAEAHDFEAMGKECYWHWCDDCPDFTCADGKFTQKRNHIWCNCSAITVH